MEMSKAAKISVFIALFISFFSMCLTVKLHYDIEDSLDILNYGVTENDSANSYVKTYTARDAVTAETTEQLLQTETVTDTESEYESTPAALTESNGQKNIASVTTQTNKSVTEKTGNRTSEKSTKSEPQTLKTTTEKQTTQPHTELDTVFVYSKNSKKLHSRSCPYAAKIKEDNLKSISSDELEEYLNNGFEFCANCQGFTTVE